MIRCASVYTYEIDDKDTALNEIKNQLERKLSLLENTVGVIMCHTEFIDSGVLKHICENAPFELAGVTTASQAVNDEVGELILTIFVITSDDVSFKIGVTESLKEEILEPIKTAYEKASNGMPEEPALALIFPPLISDCAGDAYITAFEKLIPNTPLFGTLSIDDTINFEGSRTIYNGLDSATGMSFILCYGNINPRFIIGTLPEGSRLPYQGEITKSDGPFVYEINNMKAHKYFKELGFINDKITTDSFMFISFAIDSKNSMDYDGVQIMRVLTNFTEDGTAVFRGNVDEKSIFTLSQFTSEDVMTTTLEKVDEINRMPDVNGALSFSCIIRRMVLGVNPLLELERYRDKINPQIPFMMGYAGGEICPTSIKSGIPTNRFHNYTFITLVI